MFSPFSEVAPLLASKKLPFIPIIPHDAQGKYVKSPGKCPGKYSFGEWYPMNDWDMYTQRLPSESEMQVWMSWPSAGIGLPLGRLSGLVAVDLDHDIDGAHQKILDLIPWTPLQKTGAKGCTYFYRYQDHKTGAWSKNGKTVLDLLSDGRQTVLPPSVHPDGMQYMWCNECTIFNIDLNEVPLLDTNFAHWMDEMFEPPESAYHFDPSKRIYVPASYNYQGETTLEKVAEALKFVGSDDYHQWIHVGMAIKDEFGDVGYSLWDSWSQTSPKYFDKKTHTKHKWKSFKREGLSIATVFYLAQERGWTPLAAPVPEMDMNFTANGLYHPNHPMWGKEPPKPKNPAPPNVVSMGNYKTEKEIPQTNVEKPDWETVRDRRSNAMRTPLKLDEDWLDLTINAPGMIGVITKWMLRTSPYPQPVLCLAATIAFLGLVKAHRVQSETGLRTNMYTMGIAPSGAGKKHPADCINILLDKCELSDCRGGEPASASGLFRSIVDSEGRKYLQIDEMGRFLKMIASAKGAPYLVAINTLMIKLFSCADTKFIGAEYANVDKKRDRQDIEQPNLSVFATTVPGNLYEAMTNSDAIDGYLSRWLLFESPDYVPVMQKNKGTNIEPPQMVVDRIRYWQQQPTNVAPLGNFDGVTMIRPRIIPYSAAVSELAQDFVFYVREISKPHADARTGLDAIYARTAEHAIKLALIATEGDTIGSEEFDWAMRVALKCSNYQCQVAQDRISSNEHEANVKRILHIIKEAGENGIKKTEVLKKTRRIKLKDRNDILQELEQSEVIRATCRINAGNGKEEWKYYYVF